MVVETRIRQGEITDLIAHGLRHERELLGWAADHLVWLRKGKGYHGLWRLDQSL